MKKGAHAPKTLRRMSCGAAALLLAVSIPLNTLAAEYTVSNGDELHSSWNDANNNSDATNSFYITNDIEVNTVLEAEAGKTYIVSSAGSGDYELSDVHIEASSSGGGTVIINTDVTGTDESALVVLGEATVAVNGDVTTTSNTTENGNYTAVNACDGANLTINGDVTAAEAGVYASDANITVRGDVTLKSEGDEYNNFVIDADMGSNIVVVGDVTTEEIGVLSMRDSNVVIYGDLTLESTGEVDTNNNVISASEGNVKVTGTVSSEEGGISSYKGTVTVGKDVIVDADLTDSSAFPPTVVSANNHSTVNVGGTVISSGEGIYANLSSDVTVEGGMIVEGTAMYTDKSTVTVNGNITSNDSSQIVNGSNVTIRGDFALNPDDDEGRSGELIVNGNSKLYMANGTMLEADAVHAVNNSTLNAALVKADYASVGAGSTSSDKSEFYAYTTTADSGISMLTTGGSSKTWIAGDVDTVYASENSYVEILGDAAKVYRKDNARVIENIGYGEVESHLPTLDTEDYVVGNTTAHTIIELCQGYTTNSTLQKQCSEMRALLSDVSSDISNELNVGSAFWASLFDHETINTSSYLSNRFNNTGAPSFYQNENYNATSVANFKSAKSVNTYLINMFKDNLAQSMVDLSTSEEEWKQNGYAEDEALLKIFAFTKKIEDASGVVLSPEEADFLKNVTDSNGNISGPDMLEFLRRFGYYTESDSGAVLAAQRMSRAYEQIGPYMEDAALIAKLAKAGVTVYDFAKYYLADYTNQMIVLDEILANQTLSPEMFAAAVELRVTMEDKRLGTIEKAVDLIKKESVGIIKDMLYSPLAIGQAVIDIAGLITGGTKDAEDLQNGAALTILAPQLMQTFENAVMNVKNGDTSEDAVQMVYMSYIMVRRTISDMCDIMTNIGDKEQEDAYKIIQAKLDAMEIGKLVNLVD